MEDNTVNLHDVHQIGRLVIGQVYHIYDRGRESFGYTKYMSMFAPHESRTGSSYIMSVRYLGEGKFVKTNQ